jgi:hypothetical protein
MGSSDGVRLRRGPGGLPQHKAEARREHKRGRARERFGNGLSANGRHCEIFMFQKRRTA